MTSRVMVRNLQRKVPVDVVDLENFARKALVLCLDLPSRKRTDLQRLDEVSVLIVLDRGMTSLHRRFMNELGSTDVITFQHGEIFISAEIAQQNTRRFGTSLIREVSLYIVHGLLHLHGFDDRTKAGARKIQMMQQKILTKAAL